MSIQFVKSLICCVGALCASVISADNQTPTVSPIFPGAQLPYNVSVELADFHLPAGIHSGAQGQHKGKWLFIGGRTNGLHGFENDTGNFPPSQQNSTVYVIDFKDEIVYSRSLYDNSALSQVEIDSLSVTSPQFYQSGETLYITGGYGVITSTRDFSTKDALTAIDIPGLIHWVVNPYEGETAKEHIRQIFDPTFQVTGGFMSQIGDEPTLLVFGQKFTGFYFDSGDGEYTKEIRRFRIMDDGKDLNALIFLPKSPNEDYRRRDGNTVSAIRKHKNCYQSFFINLSGVFTLTGGAWTVPVIISANGDSFMANPALDGTFKQGMNNYVSPYLGLYSRKSQKMYNTIFGGISFGYFSNGVFETDSELPFINQITTISLDKHFRFKQYIMDATYPVILSTGANPGNQLLFGAAADFVPVHKLKAFKNGVVDFDSLKKGRNHVGYILGGIQSTLPNTNTMSDSSASNYIFKVYVDKK